MHYLINTDKIGEPLDDKIRNKFRQLGIPECIGNLSPPLVTSNMYLSIDIFENKDAIPDENIVIEDITTILDPIELSKYESSSSREILSKMCIDVNGEAAIEDLKNIMVEAYVNHISRCVSPSLCKYFEPCRAITFAYLKNIELSKMR